ncbi:hypothetical protein RvY_09321 [Ramazzottius varieornatus]|uniref:arginine kinase n=1 Tax=Ramazzottius varieornatus TaxID=947166 RepID=A0A1D1VB55_RAMVA|nr:hypothetical protein RvY_09321 [Ramazzottius varieornatus]
MARRLILRFGLPLGVSAGLAYNIISRLDKLPASHVASCANLQPESSTPSTVTAKTTVRLYSTAQSFPDFRKHTNVLAQYLSSDLYALLRDRQTPAGVTLDQCIQVGVDQPGHPRIKTLGIFAGDEESYQVFREVFDLVIMERHGGYTSTDKHPTNLDSSLVKGGYLDPDFVISCRIRAVRNIRGFRLPIACSRAERREIEWILKTSLESLRGNLKGRYTPIKSLSNEDLAGLSAEGFAFCRPSAYYSTSGIPRDWPDGRGTWYNYDRTLIAFVNECEDELKLISMLPGGDMKQAFDRFCEALTALQQNLRSQGFEWMYDDSQHLGFITSCPSNLGTGGLRASVFIKLPLLSQDERFPKIVKNLKMHKHVVAGMEDNGVYDISNADRLGISEVDTIQQVIDAVHLLVRMEKRLQSDRSIDHLIPI